MIENDFPCLYCREGTLPAPQSPDRFIPCPVCQVNACCILLDQDGRLKRGLSLDELEDLLELPPVPQRFVVRGSSSRYYIYDQLHQRRLAGTSSDLEWMVVRAQRYNRYPKRVQALEARRAARARAS